MLSIEDEQIEVVNYILGNIMGSLNHENAGQWDYVLSQIEFAYNNVSNRSSRKSLFKIIYIGPPLHTLDLIPLPRMLKLSIISNHMEKKIIKCL